MPAAGERRAPRSSPTTCTMPRQGEIQRGRAPGARLCPAAYQARRLRDDVRQRNPGNHGAGIFRGAAQCTAAWIESGLTALPGVKLREIAADAYARDVLPLTAPYGREIAICKPTSRKRWQSHAAATAGGTIARSGFSRARSRWRPSNVMNVWCTTDRDASARSESAPYSRRKRSGAGDTPASCSVTRWTEARPTGTTSPTSSPISGRSFTSRSVFARGSREISLRADTLGKRRLEVVRLEDRDWSGVRRCFELCEPARAERIYPHAARLGMDAPAHGPVYRTQARTADESRRATRPRDRRVRSGRPRARARCVFVDEYGFADDAAAELIPALLRAAAGDLRRIVGWLPPSGARELLPRGSVRKRKSSVLMAHRSSPERASSRAHSSRALQISAGPWITSNVATIVVAFSFRAPSPPLVARTVAQSVHDAATKRAHRACRVDAERSDHPRGPQSVPEDGGGPHRQRSRRRDRPPLRRKRRHRWFTISRRSTNSSPIRRGSRPPATTDAIATIDESAAYGHRRRAKKGARPAERHFETSSFTRGRTRPTVTALRSRQRPVCPPHRATSQSRQSST